MKQLPPEARSWPYEQYRAWVIQARKEDAEAAKKAEEAKKEQGVQRAEARDRKKWLTAPWMGKRKAGEIVSIHSEGHGYQPQEDCGLRIGGRMENVGCRWVKNSSYLYTETF